MTHTHIYIYIYIFGHKFCLYCKEFIFQIVKLWFISSLNNIFFPWECVCLITIAERPEWKFMTSNLCVGKVCYWSLFVVVKWTIFQHWFIFWLCADKATSHYLTQWWLHFWRICVIRPQWVNLCYFFMIPLLVLGYPLAANRIIWHIEKWIKRMHNE